MGVKLKQLSRRTFLRGAGVALGLPLLEAMLARAGSGGRWCRPEGGRSAGAGGLPILPQRGVDGRVGAEEDRRRLRVAVQPEPLKPVRDSVVVLSGLDKPYSRSGDGHYAKTANFLTGLHVRKTTGQDLNAGGTSVDQVAANHVGHLTPLPSLELATDPVINGLDRAVNYTRMYGSYISWRRPDLPMPRLIDPRAAFERMFGARDDAGRPLPQPARADDQGLLDAALDDARDLRRRLGRGDQQKLEEYLDAVRGVERRLGYSRA